MWQDLGVGWFDDPTGRHQQRWFSAGSPTELVHDNGIDGHDPLDAIDTEHLRQRRPIASTVHEMPDPAPEPDPYSSPHGPVAWWDTAVPRAGEPPFDWGIGGAAGYRITREARLAYRGGTRPTVFVSGLIALIGLAVLFLLAGLVVAAVVTPVAVLVLTISWHLWRRPVRPPR